MQKSFRQLKTPTDLGMSYAKYLIELVHLDLLTGQSVRDIFNESYLKKVQVSKPVQISLEDTGGVSRRVQTGDDEGARLSPLEIDLYRKLEELYEEYYELAELGKRNFSLEEKIVDIENQLKELNEPDVIIPSQPNNS